MVIALAAFIFAYFLIVVARNPVKNINMLKAVIISAAIASLFSIVIIWKVDFVSLGGAW